MARYSLRNGEVRAPSMSVKHLTVENVDNEGKFVAPYVRLKSVAKGDSDYYYLHVGTAGRVCASTTAPVGTSGAYANIGTPLGTVA